MEISIVSEKMPASVLALLSENRPCPPNKCDRVIHRPEDRGPRHGLTYQEVVALIEDGVLQNDWVGPGLAVAVKGDDHRAVTEFRAAVYEAWIRLQELLAGDDAIAA
jgi:hypothetical protein